MYHSLYKIANNFVSKLFNIIILQNEDSNSIPITPEEAIYHSNLGSCSEVFTNTLTGYPKYEIGFTWTGCDDLKSLYKEVTFLFNFMDQGKYLAKSFGKNTSK